MVGWRVLETKKLRKIPCVLVGWLLDSNKKSVVEEVVAWGLWRVKGGKWTPDTAVRFCFIPYTAYIALFQPLQGLMFIAILWTYALYFIFEADCGTYIIFDVISKDSGFDYMNEPTLVYVETCFVGLC